MSLEEVERREAALMERYGWMAQMVEATEPDRSWAYTVGLSANFGRPDLLVRGVPSEQAGRMVATVGEMVAEGDGLDETELAERGWFLFDVDPTTLEPHQVAAWEKLAGRAPVQGDFLEIVSLGTPRGTIRPVPGAALDGRRWRPAAW